LQVSYGFGSESERRGGDGRALGTVLRSVGRVALWALVALLLARGVAAVLASPAESPAAHRQGGAGQAADALAVRFARAFLEDPSPRVLSAFLVGGAHVGAGRSPSGRGTGVAQAEVVRSSDLGGGRSVLTVACELRDSRTLYVAVPIARFGAGEAAVLGAPSIVAVPAVAGADPERPRPLAGPGAAQIRALVERFLSAYLSARRESDLRYYLAPGAGAVPLGGAVRLLGVSGVVQLGDGEGVRREVLAAARVAYPASGAAYPLAYRIEVTERGGRWYVAAVRGAVS
jgi:Conjugative transposon protein TcpC